MERLDTFLAALWGSVMKYLIKPAGAPDSDEPSSPFDLEKPLGQPLEAPGRGDRFAPVRIRGGPISDTVLGDRR